MSETTRAFRKTRVGIVISDKMDKTIVVAIALAIEVLRKLSACSLDVVK